MLYFFPFKMMLETQLAALESAQLVRLLPEENLYTFRHSLTHETAYGSLLAKKRRELHLLVAQALEGLYPESLDEYAPLLAEHYWQAGNLQKTLEYSTRAGDSAARTYSNAEAIQQYRRALDIARETGADASLVGQLGARLGRTYELAGKYDDALAVYGEMEELAHERSEPALELQALLSLATPYVTPSAVYDPAKGRVLCERALALARELGDRAAEARILWNLELLYGFAGQGEESQRYGRESAELARRYGLDEQLAYSLSDLTYSYQNLGKPAAAIPELEQARAIWERLNNKPLLANTLATIGENYFYLGRFDLSLALSDQALQISKEIGNLWGQAYSQMLTGYIHWELGGPAKAIQAMSECVRASEESGFSVPQLLTRGELGLVYVRLGAVNQGLELARRAQAFGAGIPIFQYWAHAPLGRALVLSGNLDEGREHLEAMRAGLVRTGNGDYLFTVNSGGPQAEIELALAGSDYARALKLAVQFLADMRRYDAIPFIPEALYLSACSKVGLGDMEAARADLDEARAIAESLGARWQLWRILALTADLEAKCGHREESAALKALARDIIHDISDHTPADLRDSFLHTPPVAALFET